MNKFKKVYDIIIVGGGTSGLTSAILLKSLFIKLKIAIIKPENDNIIGVGEGTTEHWNGIFQTITGISPKDLIKKTDATFKFGVEFRDWGSYSNQDLKKYYHSLLLPFALQSKNLGVSSLLCYSKNLLPHQLYNKGMLNKEKCLISQRPNQFHFNTFKLNEFLVTECSNRNIDIIHDTVNDIIVDEEENVDYLICDKDNYKAIFYVDCTGFKRLFSNKFDIKFIDESKHFPLNSAIPFREKRELNSHINLMTISQAEKYGWIWEIQTQYDIGRGYVYSTKFADDDTVKKEIDILYGDKFDLNRVIRFTSGHLEKALHKNFISVGLAYNFYEPLEATNITSGIFQLNMFSYILYEYIYNKSIRKYYEKKFNKRMKTFVDNFSMFIELHYLNSREDSEFWQYNKYHRPQSKQLLKFKETLTDYGVNKFEDNTNTKMFTSENFNQILYGLGHINSNACINRINYSFDKESLSTFEPDYVINYKNNEHELDSHENIIFKLKNDEYQY